MPDTSAQLAELKKRIASIDARFASKPTPRIEPQPVDWHWTAEDFLHGDVVENHWGEHFQTERLFPAHKRHGSSDVGALNELPEKFLSSLAADTIPHVRPQKWAFLDTETTGLAGGCGTYAFLVGIGRITAAGFTVRQFLMRDFGEEESLLAAIDAHLRDFDVLVTYNGKTYDQPLLETRYRMVRQKPPFARLGHLDLLHGARNLWKLRFESCRLVELERQILGFEREGDLPGDLIPYVYFEYVRSREAARLVPIFHHNAMDILTLACLTAIVPAAFHSIDPDALAQAGVRRGEDLAGIARWLLRAQRHEQALDVSKRAVKAGLPDGLLFRMLWDIALLEKKLHAAQAAAERFIELASCRNEYRVPALEELAKYYEHRAKDCPAALAHTKQALGYRQSAALERRKARLERRLAKVQAQPSL